MHHLNFILFISIPVIRIPPVIGTAYDIYQNTWFPITCP